MGTMLVLYGFAQIQQIWTGILMHGAPDVTFSTLFSRDLIRLYKLLTRSYEMLINIILYLRSINS
jgi:hypothetical protein